MYNLRLYRKALCEQYELQSHWPKSAVSNFVSFYVNIIKIALTVIGQSADLRESPRLSGRFV